MSDDRDQIKAIFEDAGEPDEPGEAPPPRVRLPGISARAYEHPTDRAALATLRKLPGFDVALRKFIGAVSERSLRYLYLANAVRVNGRQLARLDALFAECCAVLDFEKRPEFFVAQTPLVNAGAVGVDDPFVVVNSGTLALLDDEEVRFVLGHELGHILSGHALYKTMLGVLMRLTLLRAGIPLGGLAVWALIAALREWDRKSELSADRAGLLCLQSPEAGYRVQMKMAGGNFTEQMSVDEFVLQAEEYERGGDLRDGALKLLNLLGQRHPFPVLRLAELRRWVDAGDYARVLGGDYPRRDGDANASVYDELTAGAEHARARAHAGEDPLLRFVHEVSTAVSEAGQALWDQVRSLFPGGPGEEAPPPKTEDPKTEDPKTEDPKTEDDDAPKA